MNPRLISTSLVAAFALPAIAHAQLPSFYIDIGSAANGFGTPSSSFSGAASIPGVWQELDTDLVMGLPHLTMPLMDTTGTTSGVTLEVTSPGGGLLPINFDEPNTTGDDQALMDDVGYFNGPGTFTFMGLPPGTYDVITYAMAPDSAAYLTDVDIVGSPSGIQTVGGDFSGGYVLGTTHALHTVTVSAGGDLVIDTSVSAQFDSINGIQIIGDGFGSGLGTNYCTAVANTTGVAATIGASGSPLAAVNNLTLTASDLPPNQFGIFVTSMSQAFVPGAGGTSNGNLCLGGALGRFTQPSQIVNSGAMGEASLMVDLTMFPQGSGFVPVNAGETWNFQMWYRDTVGAGSNFSDGLELMFN